jgi:hypothetical protein
MSQTTLQFERALLRMGSIAFLAGLIIFVVSTMFHASREDPTNHPLVFVEYADSDPCLVFLIVEVVVVVVVVVTAISIFLFVFLYLFLLLTHYSFYLQIEFDKCYV